MKITCKTIIVMIWLLIMLPCFAASETMYVMCSEAGRVNIRTRATVHAEISGYMYAGDQVETIGSRRDGRGITWYHIDGVTEYGSGWVSGEYLVSSPIVLIDSEYQVVSNGRVAVRSTPGGNRTGWIRDGDPVHVYQIAGGWARTNLGYISQEYLQPIN